MKKQQQSSKLKGSEDPFEVLDALLPPEKPTKPISEREWKKLTNGIIT